MIYRKNLRSWEQAARVGAGVVVAAASLWALPGAPLGYLLAAAGAAFTLTGVFGYCPMCAVAGRRPIGGNGAPGR